VYGKLDGQRSLQRVGLSHVRPPKDMMASGKTVLPLRALLFIKSRYPRETFEAAFRHLFHCFWTPPNAHLADPSTLTKALCDVPAGPESDARLFTLEEVEAVIQAAGTKEMKDLLRDKTQEALDHGAFGAPWLWVTNAAGVSEPFFGSDR
jgi:2-hydroxychromene-2-carboxylate isomerase